MANKKPTATKIDDEIGECTVPMESAQVQASALEGIERTLDAPKVSFKNGYFWTPDGSRFNTKLKAEQHLIINH